MLIFYILLALIAVVGAVALIANLTQQDSSGAAPAAPRVLRAPVGTTPKGFYYKGNPDAPVKVVEYADYQCPHCAAYAREIEPTIDSQYVETGKIQMVYHEFPLPQFPYAIKTAEAGRCAGEQGKFWPMHDLLFQRQRDWTDDPNITARLAAYAAELGMDRAAFERCLSGGKWTAAITAAAESGMKAGIQSTPTFEVDGKQVFSDQVQATIDAALKAKGK